MEDTGIALGQLKNALGNKQGIVRYGSCHLPMDDAQIELLWTSSGLILSGMSVSQQIK